MKFKRKRLKEEFNNVAFQSELVEVTGILDNIVNLYSRIMGVNIELVVTKIKEDVARRTYHNEWQAIDFRTNNWDEDILTIVIGGVLQKLKKFSPSIQFQFEQYEGRSTAPHLHLEWDDDSI